MTPDPDVPASVVPEEPASPQQFQQPYAPTEQPAQPIAPVTDQTIQPPVTIATPQFSQAPQVTPQPIASSSEAFGSVPSQPSFGQPMTDNLVGQQPKKKFPTKLFIIIGAALVGVIGIGVTLWLLFFNGIPLMQYSNSEGGYSILVPSEYTKEESGSDVDFQKKGTSENDKSSITIKVSDVSDGSKDQFIELIDSRFNKEAFESGGSIIGSERTSNVIFNKTIKNGMDVRTVSGDAIETDGAPKGTFRLLIMISDKKVYMIMIAAHKTEPGLASSASRITDSFTVK